jgi:hypothetical protein
MQGRNFSYATLQVDVGCAAVIMSSIAKANQLIMRLPSYTVVDPSWVAVLYYILPFSRSYRYLRLRVRAGRCSCIQLSESELCTVTSSSPHEPRTRFNVLMPSLQYTP